MEDWDKNLGFLVISTISSRKLFLYIKTKHCICEISSNISFIVSYQWKFNTFLISYISFCLNNCLLKWIIHGDGSFLNDNKRKFLHKEFLIIVATVFILYFSLFTFAIMYQLLQFYSGTYPIVILLFLLENIAFMYVENT